MSELDEFGIVRYIIDTGDKVVSILLNDIAEDIDDKLLMKVKLDKIPIYDVLWDDDPPQVSEYILVKGVKFYVQTWVIKDYIIFQVDVFTTKSGRILHLDTEVKDPIYDALWLLQNKNLVGLDGGFMKRNYRNVHKCFINDFGVKVLFNVDHSKIDDFYGFEKYLVRTFYEKSRIRRKNKAHSERKVNYYVKF